VQFHCQRDVAFRRILRKKVEGLKHQPEMQPFVTEVFLQLGGRSCRVEKRFRRSR
jgi:hypothetical protein